jgi:hypothetical protein
MYKVGAGYSMTDMGGQEVKCPLCLGEGEVDMDKKVKVKVKRKKKVEKDDKVVDKDKKS